MAEIADPAQTEAATKRDGEAAIEAVQQKAESNSVGLCLQG